MFDRQPMLRFRFRLFRFVGLFAAWLGALPGLGAAPQITELAPDGRLSWTNAFVLGVCTVETAPQLLPAAGPIVWQPGPGYFTTNAAGSGTVSLNAGGAFFRLQAVDLSTNSPLAFTNLVQSYGRLHTIAGIGSVGQDGVNYWESRFEGGFATNAGLSRPHFAMADAAGDVFLVDKDSHAVEMLTPDGRIHTVAGTHAAGNGPDGPTPATNVALNLPNGLWVRGDGTAYILDTGNGKVRRLATNGLLTTLFTVGGGISGGRGLWVAPDESLVYFASGSNLKQWTPAQGTSSLNKQFNDLGNLILVGDKLVATDRGDNTVWLVTTNKGKRTLLFGNGGTGRAVDGTLALTNALYGVRGVWPVPTGGYFLATDYGAQLLYVDPAGVLHVLLNGVVHYHAGDGQWFYNPAAVTCGQLRSVTLDGRGNLLFVDSDEGYVRRIDFQRLVP